MKKFVAAIGCAVLLGTFCAAQDVSSAATTQDSNQSIAAAAKASRAQVKDADLKEADIRRLLDLTHAGALATQTMQNMEGSIRPLMTGALPPGEYREKLVDLFFAKFHSKLDQQQLLDLAVPLYEKYYSDDELKQLIQLYDTPLGQKMLAVTPKLVGELQSSGEKWGEQMGRQCMIEVLAEHPEMTKALQEAQKAVQPK